MQNENASAYTCDNCGDYNGEREVCPVCGAICALAPDADAPPLEVGARFTLWANQAQRPARVLAVTEDAALVMYAMPAGREFLIEVARRATVRNGELVQHTADKYAQPLPGVILRNIAVKSAPRRWRDAIAAANPTQATCHFPKRGGVPCGRCHVCTAGGAA